MRQNDLNRVVFFSIDDGASSHYLQKGEHILRAHTKSDYPNINDVLELYNLKKYIDAELYLPSWTKVDIENFIQKGLAFGKVVGKFMASINDSNILDYYESILQEYVKSFWELVNNQGSFKRISKTNFMKILSSEPHVIHEILICERIVNFYAIEIKTFLLSYSRSAEILLSIYEVSDDFMNRAKFLPSCLSEADKESILSRYLDSSEVNYNYIKIIQNARKKVDFNVSDKIRLKAKRLYESETEKIFKDNSGVTLGVSVSWPKVMNKLKDRIVDDKLVTNYSYNFEFVKQNCDNYSLFKNFKLLFEYLDCQNRINLVSKRSKMDIFEKIAGVHSQYEYRVGREFTLSQMTSQLQVVSYCKILMNMGISIENILHEVFTSIFHEKYAFANNARFSIPSSITYFEKVRLLAPEFESVLKQFKLFVEEGSIDFDLLQISSSPIGIKNIPSLNKNKYVYFNNDDLDNSLTRLFSDQTSLSYVHPFKEKNYQTFFELLLKEEVKYSYYEEYQKHELNYLIDKGFLLIDHDDVLKIVNPSRLLVLHDLYFNEVISFYHYSGSLRGQVKELEVEGIVRFDSSLFSKSEQSYFNYFLNKSEFNNGIDLRNSYLHGTQATPDEIKKHESSYFTYLKLLILTFLKIEDDLAIYKLENTES